MEISVPDEVKTVWQEFDTVYPSCVQILLRADVGASSVVFFI
jgi:hypothetical protein